MNTGETIALIKVFGNGGGGSSLPPVTSSDNGKVLGVVNGAWAADSNLFVVNVTLDAHNMNVADKTFAEISAAIDAGKQVVCVRDGKVYTFASKTSSNFYFVELHANTSVLYISISSQNKVSIQTQYQLSSLSAQDNGSEMIVKNGAWTKQKKKFLVTLTPTSPDFSGTMDKTPAEITAAYNAGQEIVFDIPSMSARIHATQFLEGNEVIRAGGMVFYDVNSSPVIITLVTDSSASTYATQIFAMTPAS